MMIARRAGHVTSAINAKAVVVVALAVGSVLLSLVLVGLDNIQDHLENPFDGIGADDVAINAEKFVERLEA